MFMAWQLAWFRTLRLRVLTQRLLGRMLRLRAPMHRS
jgi:hypothetical protein